ncbi:nitrogen regulatory protein P-II homolog isoform X1 [Brassica rapa]|uniref:nitrogen regulatory protein P-II homolog isoform X1 n=1 Tax=Brassica campestris TaxID=3711 RepID=UPI00142E1029|nr:nitrogen regulatory protein P-II homolog isoform X1 [Brassica rapa]
MSASIANPISATPLRFHFNRKNNISFSDCISISSGFRHSPPSSLDLVAKPPTNTRVSHLVRAQGSYDYIPDSKFYKVEAIVRPWRIQHVSSALLKIGIRGVTVSDVRGFGAQGGSKERHGGKLMSSRNSTRLNCSSEVFTNYRPGGFEKLCCESIWPWGLIIWHPEQHLSNLIISYRLNQSLSLNTRTPKRKELLQLFD